MQDLKLTRRKMILNTTRAVAGLTLTTACRPFGSSVFEADSSDRGFKIGVCDWVLGNMSEPSSIEKAKRLGLDGVQVSLGTAGEVMKLRRPDVQREFLKEAEKTGVEVASIAIGELNNVPYKSEPETEEWVSDSIDVCKAMGCKVVLLAFFGKGDLKGDKKGTDVVVERLKRVAPKAEKAGVYLGIESWLSGEEHMDIIDRVGSPAVKVYYDVGNSKKAGYDIYKEIRRLGEHICEFHAKDYDDLYGKGTIDFVKVREAMDDIGYRGWIHIEGVKMPLGQEESIRYDAQYLRTIFPAKV